MRALSTLCLGLLGLGWAGVLLFDRTGASAAETPAAAGATFERDIRPILKAHCIECHGEWSTKAGLDLRLRRFAVAGGDSGPAIVAGKPGESLLLERIKSGEMPPRKTDKKLTPLQVAAIERWIAAGAPTARPEPEKYDASAAITEENRQFWSFQPIRRPEVPKTGNADRVRTPIDAFLLEKLEEHGASFSPDADRRLLVRRVYFDLLGLPPTIEQMEQALSDTSGNWYEKLIDQVLALPQYGERWGRHWLDVAGYTDSEGATVRDNLRPHAYRYRDYVIRSFNADKPFDQFIREQLAGDEMVATVTANPTPEQAEKLSATGFLQMAPDGTGAVRDSDERLAAHDQLVADSIKIVSTSLLGLSLGCARCHDHRYDPITQDDYYRFRAIFEPAFDINRWMIPKNRQVSVFTDEDRQQAREVEAQAAKVLEVKKAKEQEYVKIILEKELAKLPEDKREAAREAYHTPEGQRTADQKQVLRDYPRLNFTAANIPVYDRVAAVALQEFDKQAAKIRQSVPKEGFIQTIREAPGNVPVTRFLFRGEPKQPKHELQPGELTILQGEKKAVIPVEDPALPGSTGRRLAYARHLTDGSHPLVARVIVNRAWLHHFGRGIVATPADFGASGEAPSHPKLLDWLAREFMDNGWSLKRLHRTIMASTAYRQGWQRNEALESADPDNRLLGGMKLRRLEAESIRDSILAVSGKLNAKSFGPAVPVMPNPVGEIVIGIENANAGLQGAVIPLFGEEFRRSVYVQVRRSRPLTFMQMFNAPVMEPNCEARSISTVAPQSLVLLNSPFIVEQSQFFAERVLAEGGKTLEGQVERAWKLAFTRAPSAEERTDAVAFLRGRTDYFRNNPTVAVSTVSTDEGGTARRTAPAAPQKPVPPELSALALLCQNLLICNEFLYVD